MKIDIKKLPKFLRKNTYDYHLVRRSKDTAVYHQTDKGNHVAFEVFQIQIQRKRVFDGRLFERKEKFPSNEDFGKTAWAPTNCEDALRIYNELESRVVKIKVKVDNSN